MQIDFLGIQAFLAIAECGSFGQAAQRLHLSQTAVSHRMRKLEESVGTPLLVRTTRGVAMTQAGSAFLPQARAAVQQLEASCEMVRMHTHDANRWIAFGLLPTLSASVLVPLVQRHEREQPHFQLRVFDSSPVEILDLVESGTASFGLTVLRDLGAALQATSIAEEPFVLACPRDHPFAARERIAWADLGREPLIRLSLPSGNSMTIDDAIGPARDQLNWRYEAQRNDRALDMVRGGLGATVVPKLSVGQAAGVAVVPIDTPAVRRTLGLVTRRGEKLPHAARWLCEQAAEVVRECLTP
jgi:DNA-binding transcriptional LysR family regulator